MASFWIFFFFYHFYTPYVTLYRPIYNIQTKQRLPHTAIYKHIDHSLYRPPFSPRTHIIITCRSSTATAIIFESRLAIASCGSGIAISGAVSSIPARTRYSSAFYYTTMFMFTRWAFHYVITVLIYIEINSKILFTFMTIYLGFNHYLSLFYEYTFDTPSIWLTCKGHYLSFHLYVYKVRSYYAIVHRD